MAERSLRGARVGGSSLQREEGIILAERQKLTFDCAHCGESTMVVFAAEADVPRTWECRHCARRAALRGLDVDPSEVADEPPAFGGRTPWEMLLERRTVPELEVILQERLEWLRSRRGELSEE